MAGDFEYSPVMFDFPYRSTVFEIAAKKDATKIPSTGEYYYDPFLSLWDPMADEIDRKFMEIEADKPADYETFLQDEAPDFYFYLAQDPNTSFNGWITNVIKSGGYTDAAGNTVPVRGANDLIKAVDYAWENLGGQLEMTADSPFGYRNFATDNYLKIVAANKKYREAEAEYRKKKDSVYKDLGLPDRDLRYDPRTVPGYKKWEDAKVAEAKRTMNITDNKRLEEIRVGIRRGAADHYAGQGYSPWHDAVLMARASS